MVLPLALGGWGRVVPRWDMGRCSVARALGAHMVLPKSRHDCMAPAGAGGAQTQEAPTIGW